jgi:hypothetical protein
LSVLRADAFEDSLLYKRYPKGDPNANSTAGDSDFAVGWGLPTWPYSSGWGYYPSGGLGLVLLIIVILALTGRL